MDNNEEKDFTPRDLVNNKQYRAILILIFYAIFFIGLIISARSAMSKRNKQVKREDTMQTEEKVETKAKTIRGYYSSKNANFTYKYTLNLNNNTSIYEGKKYKTKDSYTLTKNNKTTNYTSNGEFTFEKKDTEQIIANDTYYLIDFFNPDIINKIIINSMYNDNNKYVIQNKTLGKILKSNISSSDNAENTINLHYTNAKITKIEIDYSNYAKAIDNKTNKSLLTLEYKSFDTVEDFYIKN